MKISLAATLTVLVMLSACATVPVDSTPALTTASTTTASVESQRLKRYYSGVDSRLRAQGLLRTDGGGIDVPYSARNLVENFEKIALYDEYTVRNGRFVAQQTPSRLRRWTQPIRIKLLFGDHVPPDQRARDTQNVAAFAARLSSLTGLSIRLSNAKPNFHVLFLNRDEQRVFGPKLIAEVPRLNQVVIDEIVNSPRNTFCAAYAFSESEQSSAYASAIILVKAEHTDLMRLSCIHEEMAQALGLANDSPQARPSIFNDDEEFALLTDHDEKLLRMLYDRRLKLGMTPAQARAILPAVAADVMGGS